MVKIKQLLSMAAIVVICVTLIIGAYSYFTDYDHATLTAEVGTPDIVLEQTIDINGEADILNPGDVFPFDFKVKNIGEKAADIFAVITVIGKPYYKVTEETENTISGEKYDPTEPSPYKLLVDGAAVCFEDSSEVERDSSSTDRKYIYVFPVEQLSGTIETIEGKSTEISYNREFGMDIDAPNDWGLSTVRVTIEIFSKQHANTDSVTQDEWKAAIRTEFGDVNDNLLPSNPSVYFSEEKTSNSIS